MPGKMDSFKALSAQDKRHAVVNWLLDHAMIIIILLLAVYVQIQRPQFFGVPSLVNIVSLTAARLPMALGVAGCIVLAGTDLTGGRVAGLTAFVAAILLQKAVDVLPGDTPETLQRRVMEQAEWKILPKAIDLIANGRVKVEGRRTVIED